MSKIKALIYSVICGQATKTAAQIYGSNKAPQERVPRADRLNWREKWHRSFRWGGFTVYPAPPCLEIFKNFTPSNWTVLNKWRVSLLVSSRKWISKMGYVAIMLKQKGNRTEFTGNKSFSMVKQFQCGLSFVERKYVRMPQLRRC